MNNVVDMEGAMAGLGIGGYVKTRQLSNYVGMNPGMVCARIAENRLG